ncbi:methanesulfonate monooxygenase [Imbroritus primus]|jgi:methanesulfonate monooxygenase small subunit|uniref:Methanesulfonate monooxygenase n=1 Tax=Imbroritus primus TaxID=3058603 RepID=A0ACD3SRF6_9BURK|nr:methanesulfonate monooxygenase [Burkholderiaceae bacterium PBA]
MLIRDPGTRQVIDSIVYESCLAMNANDWAGFLALCEPESFRYRITNYSPEIQKDQTWMDRDWKGLKSLFDLLPRHNTNNAPLMRHATVYRAEHEADGDTVRVQTLFSLYRTELDGLNSHIVSGRTSLFAVGKYDDRIRLAADGESGRLVSRNVRLETRQIDVGSHIPF